MHADASAKLREIAVKLNAAGGRITPEETKAIRAAAEPLELYVIREALDRLPKTGGLNEYVARQRITISIRTGVRTAGVRLLTRDPATRQTDRGWVRHPTFGRREKGDWQSESIPQAAGWWTDTLRQHSHEVTPAVVAVIDRISRWIQA